MNAKLLLVLSVLLAPHELCAQLVLRPIADIERAAPEVRLWIDGPRSVRQGEELRVRVLVEFDAFIAVAHVDAAGRMRPLYPASARDEGLARGGVTYALEESVRGSLTVRDRQGVGFVFAIASPEPLDYSSFVSIGRWQFAPSGSTAFEQDASIAVERFATQLLRDPRASFGYDLETYSVRSPGTTVAGATSCGERSLASSHEFGCAHGDQLLVAWMSMECATTFSGWGTLPRHPCFRLFPFVRDDRRLVHRKRGGSTIALGGWRPRPRESAIPSPRRDDDARVVRGSSARVLRSLDHSRASLRDPRVIRPEPAPFRRPAGELPASRGGIAVIRGEPWSVTPPLPRAVTPPVGPPPAPTGVLRPLRPE